MLWRRGGSEWGVGNIKKVWVSTLYFKTTPFEQTVVSVDGRGLMYMHPEVEVGRFSGLWGMSVFLVGASWWGVSLDGTAVGEGALELLSLCNAFHLVDAVRIEGTDVSNFTWSNSRGA